MLARMARAENPVPGPEGPLLELLKAHSPSECVPLLLALSRAHAERRRPRDVAMQFARDGFVAPSMLDQRLANRLDALALEAASGFESLLLSPLAPLGCCAAVSPSSQDRIVTTGRGSEVVSDPTNVLALECARRLGSDARSAVRLCTVHQVVRAQRFQAKAGHAQHFRMLALATAGPGLPDHGFELAAVLDHVATLLRVLDAWEAMGRTIAGRQAKLLVAPSAQAIGERLRARLREIPGLALEEAPLESGYYGGVRVLLGADSGAGELVNLADTGLFDWVGKLTSNRRARFVASGLGLQLLPLLFART
jgi:hypothetical protein